MRFDARYIYIKHAFVYRAAWVFPTINLFVRESIAKLILIFSLFSPSLLFASVFTLTNSHHIEVIVCGVRHFIMRYNLCYNFFCVSTLYIARKKFCHKKLNQVK